MIIVIAFVEVIFLQLSSEILLRVVTILHYNSIYLKFII